MPLAAGTRLGPYEIVAPLGAGGMGEVYRARDPRLGRDVALKILPADVANDIARRQRFEQEARAVAALNHPNIVAIYDVGDGYIVTELVEGEPLRTAKLSLRKTLDVAGQIAGGLACAHDAGIVHRDLKPDNILLTRDGRAKILDFGLAKIQAAHTAAATETVTVRTEPGVVMGTVAYMSPEQVRGAAADHRSDIFSFGLVLYELLAGQRAFAGDTAAETMTAILKQDAPELADTVPPGVRQIVAHCLEKHPADRFQSAHDLTFALTALSQGSTTSASAIAAGPAPGRRLRMTLLAAAILAAGVAAGWLIHRPAPSRQWNGVQLGGPELAFNPRPSPDGHLLAFVAKDPDDVIQVWVMKPETGNRVMLTHRRDRGYTQSCSWSADGSHIYFDRWYDQPNGVFSVPVLGGEERMILESGWAPDALPDGSLLLSQNGEKHRPQMVRYWPDSGKSRVYPMSFLSSNIPLIRAFSDGRRALVLGAPMDGSGGPGQHLYVVDLESGKFRLLDADIGESLYLNGIAAPARDGKSVVFVRVRGNLSRVFSIPSDGSGSAQPMFTLTMQPLYMDTGVDGGVYVDQAYRPMEIVRFAAEGGRVERVASVAQPAGDYFAPLPDGRAVWTEYVAGKSRLMIGESGKEPVPFMSTEEDVAGPMTLVGTGDVALLIGPLTRRTIAIVSGGRITNRIAFDKGAIDQLAASPDGKTLYVSAAGNIWSVPVKGGDVRLLRAGNFLAVPASGEELIVEMQDPPNTKLIRVPIRAGIPTGPEQEIPIAGAQKLGFSIEGNGVRNGRLVAPGSSNVWWWPPAIFDLGTGKGARIPLDYVNDFHHMFWTADGRVIGNAFGWRSTMWKFTPE